MKQALILFVREPVLGKVKTRLAKTMGNQKALDIYKHLLLHTEGITKNLSVDKYVFFAETFGGASFNIWANSDGNYTLCEQWGNNLGERMENAFDHIFHKQYEKVCIIGSDCADLTEDYIRNAFFALENNDMVIGPTFDGGYYLLGMKQFQTLFFTNKQWSTSSVCTATINDAKLLNLSYCLLPVLQDIDTEEDWITYQSKQ